MQVIPVLDLLQGQVVRGIGGERHRYQPVVSRLTQSSQVDAVADAIRQTFGISELYVADLDAIQGRSLNRPAIEGLRQAGFRLSIDAGFQTLEQMESLAGDSGDTVILGLESLPRLELLEQAVERFGLNRVLFSLDLKHGQPLARSSELASVSAVEVIRRVLDVGCRRLLILDLADVGTGQGTSTIELCRHARQLDRDIEIWTGGGVSGQDDLQRLSREPIDRVLVASALHDGRIKAGELMPWLGQTD